MSKIVTTDIFIEKAKSIHGNKYDYSKVIYKKAKEKVCIICPIHGEFYQTPDKHLHGKGCILCGYEQQKQTNLKKYGNTCSLQNKAVNDKAKATIKSRYGVENVMQCDEIKQRQTDSVLSHYGVTNPMHSVKIQERIKQTNIKKYGTEYGFQNDDVKRKIRETNVQKYGCENPMQYDAIKQKLQRSIFEKYGVSNVMELESVRNKIKQTDLQKYGCEYHITSDVVKEKIITTNVERYGCENPMLNEDVRMKVFRTNCERYGGNSPFCSKDVRNKALESIFEKYGVDNVSALPEIQSKIIQTMVKNNSFAKSKPEDDMYLKLISHFGKSDVLRQYKDDRYPFRCDFYVKSLDLFIELNAFWMHGYHFFNINDERDVKTLSDWRQQLCSGHIAYQSAIETWTHRDLLKRETAIKNNLNYLVFWNSDLSDFYNWFYNL